MSPAPGPPTIFNNDKTRHYYGQALCRGDLQVLKQQLVSFPAALQPPSGDAPRRVQLCSSGGSNVSTSTSLAMWVSTAVSAAYTTSA